MRRPLLLRVDPPLFTCTGARRTNTSERLALRLTRSVAHDARPAPRLTRSAALLLNRGTKAALLLLLACSAACSPQLATPIADGLLAEASSWSAHPAATANAERELDRIASGVREALAQQPHAPPADVLNRIVFDELGFTREVDDTDLRFVLLPEVLAHRHGSCVGLGSLYLALGERLGWSLEAVMVPGHFYVRQVAASSSGRRNFELLRRGQAMPDSWYAERFPIAGGPVPEYGRALSPSEVRAVIAYDAGNEAKRQQRWPDARRAYQSAVARFPGFAEAHASLGALAQLLGQTQQARAHYQAAARAYPALPGLAHNLELLEADTSLPATP